MIKNNLEALSDIFKVYSPLYIVGGFVRDKLLGLEPTDVDLCSALPLNKVKEILKNTNFNLKIKNEQFGTACIFNKEINFEYSVFRKDIYKKGKFAKHSPYKVEFVDNLNIDSARRDFTINAMYYNLINNELIDLYNGKRDIENKLIRVVNDTTLNYDGERILRLVKFAGQLDFEIEEKTLELAKNNSKNVLELSNTIVQKFINSINKFNQVQKQKVKTLLETLNLSKLANLIL